MKLIAALLTSATMLQAVAAPMVISRPIAGHPLIGKWQWTRSMNKCTEVYDFRDDGTVPVISGTERTDNVYTVAVDPDINGFYRMTIRTTKDHGGKDCGNDESDSTGVESTNYLFFNASRDQYRACYEPSLNKCFGPLRRIAP